LVFSAKAYLPLKMNICGCWDARYSRRSLKKRTWSSKNENTNTGDKADIKA